MGKREGVRLAALAHPLSAGALRTEQLPRPAASDANRTGRTSRCHDSFDLVCGDDRVLVLPDADHRPTFCFQPRGRVLVSVGRSLQLLPPPPAIRLWASTVLGAGVPETSVNEDCNSLGGKHEVSTSRKNSDRLLVHPIPVASPVQFRAQCSNPLPDAFAVIPLDPPRTSAVGHSFARAKWPGVARVSWKSRARCR